MHVYVYVYVRTSVSDFFSTNPIQAAKNNPLPDFVPLENPLPDFVPLRKLASALWSFEQKQKKKKKKRRGVQRSFS
jgi:hypothetical protein